MFVQPDNIQIWKLHHDLMNPLTSVSGRTQLLQRQILRADGLSNLERDQLLGNVVAVLATVQVLEARIAELLSPGTPLPVAVSRPPTIT